MAPSQHFQIHKLIRILFRGQERADAVVAQLRQKPRRLFAPVSAATVDQIHHILIRDVFITFQAPNNLSPGYFVDCLAITFDVVI